MIVLVLLVLVLVVIVKAIAIVVVGDMPAVTYARFSPASACCPCWLSYA